MDDTRTQPSKELLDHDGSSEENFSVYSKLSFNSVFKLTGRDLEKKLAAMNLSWLYLELDTILQSEMLSSSISQRLTVPLRSALMNLVPLPSHARLVMATSVDVTNVASHGRLRSAQ